MGFGACSLQHFDNRRIDGKTRSQKRSFSHVEHIIRTDIQSSTIGAEVWMTLWTCSVDRAIAGKAERPSEDGRSMYVALAIS